MIFRKHRVVLILLILGATDTESIASIAQCENSKGLQRNYFKCYCGSGGSGGSVCQENKYCDSGNCSNAKCPTKGLCTNQHISAGNTTRHFEGYKPNAKCVTEECDNDEDIETCCEKCVKFNEEAGRCGHPCTADFNCTALQSMPNYVRPPANYRSDKEGLQNWEIKRFNTGKFDNVCSGNCTATPQNVETCCLRADSCDEHHQNSLCVNTQKFADPVAIGSWDGSKTCEGYKCTPEECCDFINCTCENGNPAFPPQCVNNTNVCQSCNQGHFKINATHCYPTTHCASKEYMSQIPNLGFDTRCQLLNVCTADVEYISANETNATVSGTGTNRICSPITRCDYNYQFQKENYTLYTDSVCTNLTICNTSTYFESTPANETTNRVCTELLPPCNYSAGQYIAQANNLTHDRICLNISFTDCKINEYMFQNYSETKNRICKPLTVCNLTEFVSVNATIDSDRICSKLTECDLTQEYIRVLSTDYTDRKCSPVRACSGFEFISVNESNTSNRVCTPLSKCSVTEYAAPQNTTYFDRVCSKCEANNLTVDGATCLGCMTEGNCKYNQSALVQNNESCFTERCTTYTLNNTYEMEQIVLINDKWVRFDVIGGVEPDITGDVEKVYNDQNELLYLYFQVPVTVEDFNVTLNNTKFLLRQNCVVTILLEDKCVSDPLVDLCDSNYTRTGRRAIWWEILYPPLEGGEPCPGSGNPKDPYYVNCSNDDCDRDCNETCPYDWTSCLNEDENIVECEEEGFQNKTCQIHTHSQNNGIACTPPSVQKCIGPIPAPFCDCKKNVIDNEGICGGSGCPLGTFVDLCGICNGTNDCSEEVKLTNEQREAFASVLYWVLIIAVVILVAVIIYWIGACCCSCADMQQRFRENDRIIYERYNRRKREGKKTKDWEEKIASQYLIDLENHRHTFGKYKDQKKIIF